MQLLLLLLLLELVAKVNDAAVHGAGGVLATSNDDLLHQTCKGEHGTAQHTVSDVANRTAPSFLRVSGASLAPPPRASSIHPIVPTAPPI